MADRDEVCVLVPTFNEAAAIGEVVSGFREAGYENVLVIDGGSTDGTRQIAEDEGARVLTQSGSGKGQAVREAIRRIDAPIILMVDGDATYRPADADAMLEPIFEGRANHVIGDRFADMEPGAMSRLNRVGNRLINWTFSLIHGRNWGDILSGYRAFTRESVERFALSADGFGIETELAVECVKHGVPVDVVDITYEARPEATETNLRPVRDGFVIVLTLYQMAKTNNPLFYFGSVGTLSGVVGLLLGIYVAIEWFTRSISHEVLAFLAGVAIIFGVQLIMFGVLSDMLVTVNREQTRRLEQLATELSDSSGDRPGRAPADEREDRTSGEADQSADL
jgi:glycosyltransferase (TIGR04182 family)